MGVFYGYSDTATPELPSVGSIPPPPFFGELFYYLCGMNKICVNCGEIKELELFIKDKQSKTGYGNRCKKCDSIKQVDKRRRKMLYDEEYRMSLQTPIYKLKNRLRLCVRNSFKRKGYLKSETTYKILGDDWSIVKIHFENLFTDGMNWDNMDKWHIDHIIPLRLAETEEDVFRLCHYTNLQPLWAIDNLKKGGKIL